MSQFLFVCSGGGHLKQLFTLSSRFGIDPADQHWVTFDNGLSRSLLEGRRVTFSRFAAPRDARPIAQNAMIAHRILAKGDYSAVFSTGSSPAVSFMPEASMRGIECHYVESAARADGPSITGKIMARLPGVNTYTQYPVWADERWLFGGSIFDAYTTGPDRPVSAIRRAVISVGTQDLYPFDRLIAASVPLLKDAEVLWQTGLADVSPYGIEGRASVPHHELQEAVKEADVVIAHAGTGAAITAIEAGKVPILVPRLVARGEHIDDHQIQIARELDQRGLAIAASPEELTEELLLRAASRTAALAPAVPPFRFSPSRARSARRSSSPSTVPSWRAERGDSRAEAV
ncbi:glycosyl transferase family 28 [Rathayibacter sp. VKM Ac-2856]|uniref:glycosyltransferase n=1 Tax=unclassified Rathayibacter TaxID=2609250 RepID=UPI00156763E4|nr:MULTISPECIES: glycosyltransferase [unclassified Rathayibacter]NQX05476.1 glycosyl transferase family 28 [Rathayibacter sp. VKM Ac-2858]NQX20649.1 glycosyl transferase family 28 [Rathayibacter sp. VKM Ac-2856]